MTDDRAWGPAVLEHVAIWAQNLEATTRFLTEIVGWRRHPMTLSLGADLKDIGEMSMAFIDGNGLWLELVQPMSAGPGMDLLNERGDGALQELDFEVRDFSRFREVMDAAGIAMLNMDGSPLQGSGRISGVLRHEDGSEIAGGELVAFFPADVSGGSSVEVFARGDGEPGLLDFRDRAWTSQKGDTGGPHVRRVVVLVRNLEKTARFYTDILHLKAASVVELEDANSLSIDCNGVHVELVQPTQPGFRNDLLQHFGDGYLMGIAAEVRDIYGYLDHMRAKGIVMVDLAGMPALPERDRDIYFPLAQSMGMRISVSEPSSGQR